MSTIIAPEKVHTGMGATPHESGVAFRVWAPHADAVYVVGSFNDWSTDKHPMEREGDGYWYADISSAAIGNEYRYRIVSGDKQLLRLDPYARQVTSSVGNAVVYDPNFDWEGDDFHLPPVNELVIYEMHLGTFHDKEDGKSDKFEEALQKLDHLQRLGVNVMEVMPLAQFAGNLSWGYNPSCVFAVETNYGGPAAFKRFVKAVHRAGLAVILDVVYNHFGPSDLDLWQFDGWSENGAGGIYFYNDWHSETPWGSTRPDYGRKEVRQFIRDNRAGRETLGGLDDAGGEIGGDGRAGQAVQEAAQGLFLVPGRPGVGMSGQPLAQTGLFGRRQGAAPTGFFEVLKIGVLHILIYHKHLLAGRVSVSGSSQAPLCR